MQNARPSWVSPSRVHESALGQAFAVAFGEGFGNNGRGWWGRWGMMGGDGVESRGGCHSNAFMLTETMRQAQRGLLLAVLAMAWSSPGQQTGLYRELYFDLDRAGNSLAQLTNAPAFLSESPSQTNLLTSVLETEANRGTYYGQRVRGYLLAPTNGEYVFWIASDKTSCLYLSPDENPARKRLVGWVDPRSQARTWTEHVGQQSSNVFLEAGRYYYLEVLHHQTILPIDHLSVRWRLPDGTLEEPIPATRFVHDLSPVVTQPPASQTVTEGRAVTFRVEVANFLGPTFRWQRDGVDVAGATNQTLSLPWVTRSDDGARFSVTVSNSLGATNGPAAVLRVAADLAAPALRQIVSAGPTNVLLIFDEPLDDRSAGSLTHYAVDEAPVLAAAILAPGSSVLLSVAPLTPETGHVLRIGPITDRAGNVFVGPAGGFAFTNHPFFQQTVGGEGQPGQVALEGEGWEVTATGMGLGERADQLQFGWQLVAGDFDFQVQLAALSGPDLWASAGLMARESLEDNSRFAALLATPSLTGCYFQCRTNTGWPALSSGAAPAAYPSAWLRLRRTGQTITGFAGDDGQRWTQLGSATMVLPARAYVGLALASHSATNSATARFQSFAPVAQATEAASLGDREALGPSSRRTGLAISEIMYHPREVLWAGRPAELEFVELFNSNPYFEDLSGYRLSGDIEFTFPRGTVLAGGGFVVVARVPEDVKAVYGLASVLGPYTNNLPNQQGRVRLRNNNGFLLLEVNYESRPPWPVAADGAGHSLVLARPSYGENSPRAWAISDGIGGSPGRADPSTPDPWRGVLINEILAHTEWPLEDGFELYNHGGQSVDLSGGVLTDDPTTNKCVLPAGTVLPPGGFLALTAAQAGFRLSSAGETLYWLNASRTRVLDAVRFDDAANGVSVGRVPEGGPSFYPLPRPTLGGPNGAPLRSEVIINEIMYHPISGDDDDQYVELYNRSTNVVNLGGWRFEAGISYTFASNVVLAANEYLVVARNATNLLARYPTLNATNTVGDFGGALAHGGERIALSFPQLRVMTNAQGGWSTNLLHVVANEVTYGPGGRWGHWAAGGGSSLELVDPNADTRLAPNWADSDETGKAPWTTIEATGVLDNGSGTPDALHVLLLGEGECLLDEVEVTPQGAANRLTNPTFEAGLAGWTMRGNHERSSLEEAGFNSGRSLHLRASSDGDIGANKVWVPLSQALVAGQTATLRAKVRWVRGWPEILLRVRGSYLEAVGRMTVPPNLGTPGAPNSRRVANAGPAVTDITHAPAVPAANQAIVVTARVADPDGLTAVVLKYRRDPATNLTIVTMNDAGADGDAVAGDGVYSATIPGQPADTVVAFVLEATDAASAPASSRFPESRDDNGRPRECLVHFGSPVPVSSFGTYRFWITQQSITNWSQREVLSNERIPGTFVYVNQRVIYNAGARYSGSAAHQDQAAPDYSPVGTPNHYAFDLPADDPLLGTDNLNKLHGPGNNHHDDNTLLREVTGYWMAQRLGLPVNHKRFVAMFINGARRGSLMEDTQVPNGEVLHAVFPDDPDGDLHKVSIWYEFGLTGPALSFSTASEGNLNNYTTTGGAKKPARYRWTWCPRAVHGTVNDFANLFTLVDAANLPAGPAFTQTMEGLADLENWMRTFALEHAVGNWDSFGYRNEQNMYAYKPARDRWKLLIWDINILFGGGTRGTPVPTDGDLFEFDAADLPMATLYNTPACRRAYWRALQEIAEGPMLNTEVDPVMDARFAAFAAGGVSVTAPDGIKAWISARRAYLLAELAKVNAAGFTCAGPVEFASPTDLIRVSGAAPVGVRTIQANGVAWPVTWTTLTNWTLSIPLAQATNRLTLLGLDGLGNALPGASNQLVVAYTGPVPDPKGQVVINEVLYHPLVPGSSFVEIFNASSNLTFDLSGWRLHGVDFSFPDGTFITNRQFLVVAKKRTAFASVFGVATPVLGEFAGQLQADGETLALVRPGATPAQDQIIDQVRYEAVRPWPVGTNDLATAGSIQLIDAAQDHSRPCNWATLYAPAVYDPGSYTPASTNWGWRFASLTGTNPNPPVRVMLYLGEPGELYLDDISLVAGSVPEVGANFVRNGDFESPLYEIPRQTNSWFLGTNYTDSTLSTQLQHAGASGLRLISTRSGVSFSNTVWQWLSPAPTNKQVITIGFWYYVTTTATNFTIKIASSATLSLTTNVGPTVNPPVTIPPHLISPLVISMTPAAPNQFATNLPVLPPVWLNEVQPENLTGPRDSTGAAEPWLELYNAGSTPVSLAGLFLADNYTNLTPWPFPGDAMLRAGEFKLLFCDGHPDRSTPTEWHTSFRLTSGTGTVALSWLPNGQPQVLDYLSYQSVPAGQSYGDVPDGRLFDREIMPAATPGTANKAVGPPLTVVINEWMAANTHTLVNPGTGKYDDWFELYNPASVTADLAGCYLTGNLTNQFKFRIPEGHPIPPHGFLLVWADNKSNLNGTNQADLHVNFQLDRQGESIGLFAPDGSPLDAVTFGPQTNDLSEGRFPDGTGPRCFLTTPTPRAANVFSPRPAAPRVSGIALSPGGQVSFAFNTVSNQTYRVEYSDDLAVPGWQPLATYSGTGELVLAADVVGVRPQRFYRVVILRP